MLEGSRSGSIPPANGSGSRRPKNTDPVDPDSDPDPQHWLIQWDPVHKITIKGSFIHSVNFSNCSPGDSDPHVKRKLFLASLDTPPESPPQDPALAASEGAPLETEGAPPLENEGAPLERPVNTAGEPAAAATGLPRIASCPAQLHNSLRSVTWLFISNVILYRKFLTDSSVAECGWIRDVYPGSGFFPPKTPGHTTKKDEEKTLEKKYVILPFL
jgi:hypothetical protein